MGPFYADLEKWDCLLVPWIDETPKRKDADDAADDDDDDDEEEEEEEEQWRWWYHNSRMYWDNMIDIYIYV